jgi:hypothetical protein
MLTLDEHLSSAPAGRVEALCFKSWTAYVRPTLITAIAVSAAIMASWPLYNIHVTFVLVLAILGAYAASVLSLLEDMLVLDDEGIWYCRGGFAGNPRVVGVRWRNVRCTLSRPRIRWSRTSYTVIVQNRVTSRRIVIKHMARGDVAVARINNLQQTRLLDAR